MKKLLLFVMVMLWFAGTARSQDKEAILKVLHTQEQAWNGGDIDRFMEGYLMSDSLMFVGSSGPTYGYETVKANYKKNYPGKSGMGKLTFTIKKVELLCGDTAFVMGAFHLKRDQDEPKGHFTLIFKKFKDGWKIISDHSS
jgi:ketosteroid isomerase-like protein